MDATIAEQPGIRRAHTRASDARTAAEQFHAAVAQTDMALVVFFCSNTYDLDRLGSEMQRLFAGVQLVGCTTAGEIGPAGYIDQSLSGASFPASQFAAVCGIIETLQEFTLPAGQNFAKGLQQELDRKCGTAPEDQRFALLLIDGLSLREEVVTRAVQSTLGGIPLVGGSAGDGFAFKRTQVYFDGRFRSDCALLALLSTHLPFRLFAAHHFVAADERLVVTAVDTAHRVVAELNGRPAAQEYARIVGVPVSALERTLFSQQPAVALIDGESYVRSIRQANADDSLTFYCAIENGQILRIARAGDLLANLQHTLAAIETAIGPPQLVLAFDCLQRRIEILNAPDRDRIVDLLLHNQATGFCTYGEQYRGVHINQSFTGVAIGAAVTPGAGVDDA